MSTSHSAPGQPEGTPENNGSGQHAGSGDAPWHNDAAGKPQSRRERRSLRGGMGKRGNRPSGGSGSEDATERSSRGSRSQRRVVRGEPARQRHRELRCLLPQAHPGQPG